MKALLATVLILVPNLVLAAAGGNFTCTAGTRSGDVVTISGCMNEDYTSFVPCAGEDFEFVTVTKEYWANITKMTPPIQHTLKIPGRLFTVDSAEEHFGFSIDDPNVGKIDLMYAYDKRNGAYLTVHAKGIDNDFKVLGCEQTYVANRK